MSTDKLESSLLSGAAAESFIDNEWAKLATASAATPFQTQGWYRAWLLHIAASEAATPIVIVVARGGEVRLACALQLKTGTEPMVETLTAPWSDYHDAVGPTDPTAVSALAGTLRQLAASAPIALDDILAGGLLHKACRAAGGRVVDSSPTRALQLDDPAAVAKALGNREHARKHRALQRLGDLRVLHHTEQAEATNAMHRLMALHRRQWFERPDIVAPFDGGVTDSFFLALPSTLDPGTTILSELILDRRVIASYVGFRHLGRYGAYRTAFDGTLAKYSPGHMLVREMIRTLPTLSVATFDFMRGDYRYKSEYAPIVRCNVRAEIGHPPAAESKEPAP